MIIEQIEGGRIIDCRSDDNCLFRDYRPLQPLNDSLPHSELVVPRRSWIALFFREGRAQGSPCYPPFDVPIRFRSSRSEYLQLSRKYPIGFVVVDLHPHFWTWTSQGRKLFDVENGAGRARLHAFGCHPQRKAGLLSKQRSHWDLRISGPPND
jgi:hypothetical protein